MGEDDLGVFAGFKGHQSYTSGELVEDIVLNDAADELMHLFGAAVDFCRVTSVC
jgi:hypothetical protein